MHCPSVRWLLLGLALAFVALHIFDARTVAPASGAAMSPDLARRALSLYRIATTAWPARSFGSHRARLVLDAPGDIAWARVEWRLPGLPMANRKLILVDERTGSTVRGVHVVSATTEAAEILFDASDERGGGGGARRFALRRPRRRNQRDSSYSYDYDAAGAEGRRRRGSRRLMWRPRGAPCGCSGYSNAHGYGSSCKAWESHLDPVHSCGCEETLFTVGVGVAPRPAAGAVVLRVRGVRRARRAARLVLGGLPGLHPSPRPEARHRTTPLNRPRPPPPTAVRSPVRRRVHDMSTTCPIGRRYLLYYLPYDDTPCVTGPSLPLRAPRACSHDVHDVSGTCPR